MEKQGLIIGIDYSNKYCQASYYNARHDRAESVMTGASVMRYLIPAVLSYDTDRQCWLIGEEAMRCSEMTGAYLYRDLLRNMLAGEVIRVEAEEWSYDRLMTVFFGKVIELARVQSGLMTIDQITVSLRRTDREIKIKLENIFKGLDVGPEKLRLINTAESFTYYMLNEDKDLWLDGALLFDFGNEGFFAKQLTVQGTKDEPLFYVNERNYSMDFNIKDLASEMLRIQLDSKLSEIYDEVRYDGKRSAVFFTGEGFSELWFKRTLEKISEEHRVFKGNNLYVKGNCLCGRITKNNKGKDFPIVCKGRTKAFISAAVYKGGRLTEKVVSDAAKDWYDAEGECDFLLEGEKNAQIIITSLVGKERTVLDFDLSDFPDRPKGTTRVSVSVEYLNSSQCEITVTDKGFGAFYPASGCMVKKRLDLEGYI